MLTLYKLTIEPDAAGGMPLRIFMNGSDGAAHNFKEGEDAHSVATKLHMLAIEIEHQAWATQKKVTHTICCDTSKSMAAHERAGHKPVNLWFKPKE